MSQGVRARIAEMFDNPVYPVSDPNIAWLMEDLKRLFAFHMPVNGVPNFLASMCLLTGLEFVSRFHLHPTLAEVGLAGRRVNQLTEDELRRFRNGRRGAGGRYDTDAALSFIDAFFPDEYKQPFPGCRTPRRRVLSGWPSGMGTSTGMFRSAFFAHGEHG